MSSEISGARGRDHSAEADRTSADRMRAKSDAQLRAENDAYDRRHAELVKGQAEANRVAGMFSPIGHVPLTPEARAIAARGAAAGNGTGKDAAAKDGPGGDAAGKEGTGRNGAGGDAGQAGPGQPGITHYFADYGGHHLDLYTDGKRWAGGYDLARDRSPEETRSARGDPTQVPHSMAEYLRSGERVVGIPVTGEKPAKSPGDTSDLPPTGDKLLEADDLEQSRFQKIRRRAESPEVLGDLRDGVSSQADAWQQALDKMPPAGHAVQTSRDSPNASAPVADHVSAGDIASTVVIAGIALFEVGRRFHAMLEHRKER